MASDAVPVPDTGTDSEVVPDLEGMALDLAEVEASLERLDDGTYGRCASCGGPIDDEVLEARPTSLYCDAHLV